MSEYKHSYLPEYDDFQVDPKHANSRSKKSLKYWASVLAYCDETNKVDTKGDGWDMFALGNVVVKSNHLRPNEPEDGQDLAIDWSYSDANEIRAISLAKKALGDVKVPTVYFSSKVVLVQERIPGMGLSAVWNAPKLQTQQHYKQKAQLILQHLHRVKTREDGKEIRACGLVVEDPNDRTNGCMGAQEADILFSGSAVPPDIGFMHNFFNPNRFIVMNGKIVGVVGWEKTGFFNRSAVRQVHQQIEFTPTWWQDIYDYEE
ncbi:kinase-like domain-containing protein [Hypoxylon sp. FL1150]|nr:kinase-like domain-containing protein [Hypoxylon sp. FL1150]